MTFEQVAGWLLVVGFAVFMVGAAGWRVEYEQPLERSLPVMHADRGRLRWIHRWMIPAVFCTVAGLTGLAVSVATVGVAAAAAGYAVGAVLWVAALLFRLSVTEWVAERTVVTSTVPEWYAPLARWAGMGHACHMVSAYITALPLAWSLADVGVIPGWLAWVGASWGSVLLVAFLVPRARFAAAPPFWAHTFTFAIGLALVI